MERWVVERSAAVHGPASPELVVQRVPASRPSPTPSGSMTTLSAIAPPGLAELREKIQAIESGVSAPSTAAATQIESGVDFDLPTGFPVDETFAPDAHDEHAHARPKTAQESAAISAPVTANYAPRPFRGPLTKEAQSKGRLR